MNKISRFIVEKKYLIFGIFAVLTILSAIFMNKVKINYDVAAYLDKDSGTRQALDIMEKEFEMNGVAQVMVKDVSEDKALEIYNQLSGLNGIVTVMFDKESLDYYKDNNALYVIIIDGDEYSDNSIMVLDGIKETLKGYKIYLNGSAVSKKLLRDALENEIPVILAISVAIVLVILFITATSWIEPFIFLFVILISILLNRGSNIMFKEISYITNSISAILQLALSMDYSIMLLQRYHKELKNTNDKKEALILALQNTFKPILASGLTTIAGLVGMMFMSLGIGFDIGIVLSKGIVCSMLCVCTLLPGLLLLLSNVLEKTKKKPLNLKGNVLSNFTIKKRIPLSIIAICLIVVGCVTSSFNTYAFGDNSLNKDSDIIENVFGKNEQLVVVVKNTDQQTTKTKEANFIASLDEFKIDGKSVVKNYSSYTNSAAKELTFDSTADILGVDKDQVEMLFALYHLENNNLSNATMTMENLLSYSNDLILNDNDAKNLVTPQTKKTIILANKIYQLLKQSYTINELITALNDEDIKTMASIDSKTITLMFELYTLEHNSSSFPTTNLISSLEYILDATNTTQVDAILTTTQKELFSTLFDGINTYKATLDTLVNQSELVSFLNDNNNSQASITDANYIFNEYFNETHNEVTEKIRIYDLIDFLSTTTNAIISLKINNSIKTALKDKINAYNLFNNSTNTLDDLLIIAKGLTTINQSVPADALKLVYTVYHHLYNRFESATKIKVVSLLSFIQDKLVKDKFMQALVTENIVNYLTDIVNLYNTFSYPGEVSYNKAYDLISLLVNNIKSIEITSNIDKAMIQGLYVKYVLANNVDCNLVITLDNLVEYLYNNMNTNFLIKDKLSDEQKKTLTEGMATIQTAKTMFLGKEHSRFFVYVNLACDNEDSFRFSDFIASKASLIYDNEAYVAGQMATSNDMQNLLILT